MHGCGRRWRRHTKSCSSGATLQNVTKGKSKVDAGVQTSKLSTVCGCDALYLSLTHTCARARPAIAKLPWVDVCKTPTIHLFKPKADCVCYFDDLINDGGGGGDGDGDGVESILRCEGTLR